MYSLTCTGWYSTSPTTSKQTISQCFQETFLATEMKASEVSIQKVNWKEMKLHLLKILLMFKQMEFQWLGNRLILDTNHIYCDQMNLAFPIENIGKIKNLAKTVMPHNEYQILTDVIHFQNLSLMTSKNHRAILQTDKMASLLKTLGIIPLF